MTFSLLAQVQKSAKLEKIAEGFQYDDTRASEMPGFQWFIAILGLLCVAGVFLIWRSQRNAHRATRFTPARLFAHALRQLNLSLPDRLLLRCVARAGKLDQPVVLLFSPALLDQQLTAWSDRLSFAPLRRYARSRLNVVMNKVFVEE